MSAPGLKDFKNILVIRNDRFGEFLLNIPALRAVREAYPQAHIILVVDPRVKELAEAVPYVDAIIEWGRGGHSFWQKLKLLKTLRQKKIDAALMLNPSKEFHILAYLCGARARVGYNRKWGFLLTHKIEDKKHLGDRHEVEFNLELVGLINARTTDVSLSLKIDEGRAKEIGEKFSLPVGINLVALHPWTSDTFKQWPLENFRALAEKVLKCQQIKLVAIGGPEELNKSCELFRGLNYNFQDLTGQTSLLELAVVLKKCKLLISNDSGPVHLAACVGTPVLAIFRNDIPGKGPVRWGPWGAGHTVMAGFDIRSIGVDEVFRKAKEVCLNGPG
jgi:ADP-heptose:LPS heptosyltransferase